MLNDTSSYKMVINSVQILTIFTWFQIFNQIRLLAYQCTLPTTNINGWPVPLSRNIYPLRNVTLTGFTYVHNFRDNA